MDIKIKSKHYTLIALVIVFLLFGAIIGYVVYKSANVEEPVVTPPATPPATALINETAAATTTTPDTVETTAASTPAHVAPTAAPPQEPDFTYKPYDPAMDTATRTIIFRNNAAQPYTVSIHPKKSVLFKIDDSSSVGQSVFTLVITSGNRSEKIDIGKNGAAKLVTFNNKATYTFQAIIEADNPNIVPLKYGSEGKISVY